MGKWSSWQESHSLVALLLYVRVTHHFDNIRAIMYRQRDIQDCFVFLKKISQRGI